MSISVALTVGVLPRGGLTDTRVKEAGPGLPLLQCLLVTSLSHLLCPVDKGDSLRLIGKPFNMRQVVAAVRMQTTSTTF